MDDPYNFDIDLGGSPKKRSSGSRKKTKSKKKSSRKKNDTRMPSSGMSAMERAGFYLDKYTKNVTGKTQSRKEIESDIDLDSMSEESDDQYLNPDYDDRGQRGLVRSSKTQDLHRYGYSEEEGDDDDETETKDSGSMADLRGAPDLPFTLDSGVEDDQDLECSSYASSKRKSPRSPKVKSPMSSPSSPSARRRRAGSFATTAIGMEEEELKEDDEEAAFQDAIKQIELEEEMRRQEALKMMQEAQAAQNEQVKTPSQIYKEAYEEVEKEDELRKREALAMLKHAQEDHQASSPNRSPGGRLSPSLHVEISNSNYQHEALRSVATEDAPESLASPSYYEEFYEESVEPMSAHSRVSAKSIKSALSSKSLRSVKSIRSSRSLRSAKSPKSIRSMRSARSPKSVRSVRSVRSVKSGRSRVSLAARSHLTSHDEYSMDGFETEHDILSPRSLLSGQRSPMSPRSPRSPRSPLSVRFSNTTPMYSTSRMRKPVLVDSATQHIEVQDIQVQANLVVSASGLVYEVPHHPIGAVEPTLLGTGMTQTAQQQYQQHQPPQQGVPHSSSAGCPHCQHHMHHRPSQFSQPTFTQYAWGALNNPLNATYSQVYAQARSSTYGGAVPTAPKNVYMPQCQQQTSTTPAPSSGPAPMQTQTHTGPAPIPTPMDGITASLLATNNMFKRNLEMIRSHLQDCRQQTDRVMTEINGQGYNYSTFSDVQAYIEKNRPKVRTVEEAMREVAEKENSGL